MRSSVKLDPNRCDVVIGVCVIFLAVICAFAFWSRHSASDGNLVAVVSVDGQVLERVVVTERGTHIYTNNGCSLKVSICPGGGAGVCVTDSDCPGQDCVHTGVITRGGESIVCLPARITIRLEESGGKLTGDVDAVIG